MKQTKAFPSIKERSATFTKAQLRAALSRYKASLRGNRLESKNHLMRLRCLIDALADAVLKIKAAILTNIKLEMRDNGAATKAASALLRTLREDIVAVTRRGPLDRKAKRTGRFFRDRFALEARYVKDKVARAL